MAGTGRTLFRALKLPIAIVSGTMRILPRFVFTCTWFVWRSMPGYFGMFMRFLYAKRLAAACGENVMIGSGCILRHWSKLRLGRDVTIHAYSYVDAMGGITIGDSVSIAHATSLISFEHTWDDLSLPIKYNPLRADEIHIASDVWVGCGVRILAGARIESRSVIAAGSVVTRGRYESGVYGGVPAKLLKKLQQADVRQP